MKEKGQAFDLDDLLTKIDKDSYWVDFIKIRHLEAGVLRLYPNEEDTQTPHDADELYFVVEGSGFISMGKESKAVKKGSVLFVPAGMPHHFYGNRNTLVVLYMFAE
ncbi:cupin domain-containing protein [Candidatus Nitrososphaera evergladensis SR1]|jgi:mannose-6-phosphate isomerase-like protein (cupin superfamily)|uniref:Cupin domain-containing protein n=1 Tax=Candidatus Nitrososphaera evergladensis SR1 TaxID=1459636 RepID=A0A075MTF7_9ARCH|nr:cupin domain-containing protein [Candidatus Nitrososphaera evergladensis]AIF84485.1 cupin domain-containing protein [Candidatus Nitrososphaera evergladensis SR1]